MKIIEKIVVSDVQPAQTNVAWLRYDSENGFELKIYLNNGWTVVNNAEEA